MSNYQPHFLQQSSNKTFDVGWNAAVWASSSVRFWKYLVLICCVWSLKVRNDSSQGLVSDGSQVTTNIDNPTAVKYNLVNLKSSTLYRVELRAYNQIGYSQPAELIVRTAKSELLPFYTFSVNYSINET